jgi:Mor family transcriptional regulator
MTDWQAVLTDYRSGMMVKRLRAKYKIGGATFYRFLRRVNETGRSEVKRNKRDPEIILLRNRGVPLEEIAKRFRMNLEAIRQVLIRASVRELGA